MAKVTIGRISRDGAIQIIAVILCVIVGIILLRFQDGLGPIRSRLSHVEAWEACYKAALRAVPPAGRAAPDLKGCDRAGE